MTRSEQVAFVTSLSRTVVERIIGAIQRGDVPAEWDGHELRALLAHCHDESAAMSYIVSNKRCRRWRDFRNTVIVNNL